MAESADTRELEQLRRRAEGLVGRARSRNELFGVLERILEIAPVESEENRFANRQLAELLVEEHPWRAAVHLRRIVRDLDDDDVVHALMGLCQALLGNFRCAVASYRRALMLSPRNPWYHHNLGHLIDVALGDPDEACHHLQLAHDSEPTEHEITASLAHCLARLGELEEAEDLARMALDAAPRNADHRALLEWIEEGAAAEPLVSAEGASEPPAPGRRRGAVREPVRMGGRSMALAEERDRSPCTKVLQALERGMSEAGFSPGQVERARSLWADFRDGRRVRVMKPESYAAAVEYAIALVHGVHGVTQASVARRYGIGRTTLSNRYGEIREALALRPGDPRYA